VILTLHLGSTGTASQNQTILIESDYEWGDQVEETMVEPSAVVLRQCRPPRPSLRLPERPLERSLRIRGWEEERVMDTSDG